MLDVTERLLAHAIARQHEPLPRRIPDGDGKHAAQAAESGHALGGVQVRNHLGVARGRGARPGSRELLA